MMIEMGKKYQTRDGRAVRILCVDRGSEWPVVGLVANQHGYDVVGTWDANGIQRFNDKQDLIPVPTKHENEVDRMAGRLWHLYCLHATEGQMAYLHLLGECVEAARMEGIKKGETQEMEYAKIEREALNAARGVDHCEELIGIAHSLGGFESLLGKKRKD